MARNMAYVVTISQIDDIPGCDKIGYAHFEENGYGVIVSKDFKVGDTAVMFEVDSILPTDNPKFEFLRTRCYKENINGYLIKAMKMRGVRSFGLIMTFDELGIKPCKAGTDLTDTLKIRKYEPIEDASPKPVAYKGLKGFLFSHKLTKKLAYKIYGIHKEKGSFPTHLISKSDETNILNSKKMFDMYKDKPSYASMKIEGQSVTVSVEKIGRKYKYNVHGRNTIGQNVHFNFFESKKINKALPAYVKGNKLKSIAIQGEFTAPNVQSGIYKNGTHFYVYKINVNGKTIDFNDMLHICSLLELETVPIVANYPNGFGEKFNSVEEMQEHVEHLWFKIGEDTINVLDDRTDKGLPKKKNNEFHRHEGIVFCGINKGDWSFKVKSQEYILEGL